MISDPFLVGILGVAVTALIVLSTMQLLRSVELSIARRRFESQSSHRVPAGLLIIGATVAVALVAPKMLLVVVPAIFVLHRVAKDAKRNRYERRYEMDLPEAFEQVAGNIRSGSNLLQALADASGKTSNAVTEDIRRLNSRIDNGASINDAFDLWASERGSRSVRMIGSSIALANKTGAASARVVDGVVMTLRRDLATKSAARTNATQALASAWALSLMPLVFTGSMLAFDREMRSFMLDTWAGIGMLGAGLLLDAVGFLAMQRLIRRAVR